MIDIFIKIKPSGKQRHSGSGRSAYTPKETVRAESIIKTYVKIEMLKKNIKMSTSHIKLSIIYYFKRTKHTIKTDSYHFRSKKPDSDNLDKLVMDSMNGVLYKDDAQVCILHCEKRYNDIEGIHLSAEEMSLWELEQRI